MTSDNFSPTRDQVRAIEVILEWWRKKGADFVTLGGYAGTGKTTLVAEIRNRIRKERPNEKVAFCAFTGKAAMVLRQKLAEHITQLKGDSVGTIHSLIYCPIIDEKRGIIGWTKREKLETDLIVVDEASMVNEKIWEDLKSYRLPILAVGDHGQLPPIEGHFNLMDRPILKLQQIHRQAENNPIIKLSMMARLEGKIPTKIYSPKVKKMDRYRSDTGYLIEEELDNYNDELMVLVGYNQSRIKLNKAIREKKMFESQDPQAGDKVICLRNNWQKNIFNGMTGKIKSIKPKYDNKGQKKWYQAEIVMEDESVFEGLIAADQFDNPVSRNYEGKPIEEEVDLFDFGYALTVHKAQGGSAKKVLLFEERFAKMDDEEWRRWLYTGVTRAEEELTIVGV
ncbi:MAG: AAA family ATPase [Candidatus Shapirobacteria bacterium]|jgi:exodeoxyribonuclease-5